MSLILNVKLENFQEFLKNSPKNQCFLWRLHAVAYAGKNFGGGFKVMAGLVGGPGGEPPPDAGKFSKICN